MKIAASVLLNLLISGDERWHTTEAPLAHERNSIFKCKQHLSKHDNMGPIWATTGQAQMGTPI